MLAGSHYIHLFWSDLPLVNSPFPHSTGTPFSRCPTPTSSSSLGRGLKEATVREETEFVIDSSQAEKGRANYCDENGTFLRLKQAERTK
ncbi:hypothetical protein DPMN_123382 [Dreissena polymorpha]|uniref:Uncharacterized protein n=1 Tax=Dreissena polymorpha TaxID=45954 RepID=A0A9D4JVB0_DREPO|nr:hypothetical protein DPMN_123382 [Dreissena polymorpha]